MFDSPTQTLLYLSIGRTTSTTPYISTSGSYISTSGFFISASQSDPSTSTLTSGYGTFYYNSGTPYFAYNNGSGVVPNQLAFQSAIPSLSNYATLNGSNNFTSTNANTFNGTNTFNGSVALGANCQLTFNNNGSNLNNASIFLPQTNNNSSLVFSAGNSNNLQLYYNSASNWGFQQAPQPSSPSPPYPNPNFFLDFPTIYLNGAVSCNSSLSATSSITAASFNTTSDYRIKKNVTELNETYSVDNLRPVEYENKITKKQCVGFIAHEVQEQYPFLVTGEKDGKDNQSINYQEIIPILVKEIQDLKKRVTLLEN